jgi:hypothetical protein
MITVEAAANLDETMTTACMLMQTAYEQGATNVHIHILPDMLKVIIVDADFAAIAEAHPNIPLTEVPPTSERSKPMYVAFFRYEDFLPLVPEPATHANNGHLHA